MTTSEIGATGSWLFSIRGTTIIKTRGPIFVFHKDPAAGQGAAIISPDCSYSLFNQMTITLSPFNLSFLHLSFSFFFVSFLLFFCLSFSLSHLGTACLSICLSKKQHSTSNVRDQRSSGCKHGISVGITDSFQCFQAFQFDLLLQEDIRKERAQNTKESNSDILPHNSSATHPLLTHFSCDSTTTPSLLTHPLPCDSPTHSPATPPLLTQH